MKRLVLERGPVWRRTILLVLVVGVPILFHRSLFDPFNVPKLSLLMAGTAVVASIRLIEIIQGAAVAGLRRLLVPAAAIGIPLIVAWVFTPYRGYSLMGFYGRFQGLIPYLTVILFGILLADAFEGRAHQLAWGFASAGAFMGFYALIQWMGWDPYDWSLPGEDPDSILVGLSTTGNPNFTGGFLGVALPVTAGLLLYDKRRRITLGVMLALITGGWIVASSQGAWGAGVAGTLVTVSFFVAPRARWARPVALGLAVVAASIAVGSVVFSIIQPDNTITSETVKSRGDWWLTATDMWLDHPVVGRGPNTFALEGPSYRPERDAAKLAFAIADDPHSVFFAMLTAAGILGGLGFLVALGWVVLQALKVKPEQTLAAAFLGGLVAYFVQAIVSIDELSLRLAFWTTAAGLVAALQPAIRERAGARRRSRKKRRRSKEPLRAPVAVALVAILPLAALWWSGRVVLADGRLQQGMILFGGGTPDTAQIEFDGALAMRDELRYRETIGFQQGQVALGLGEQEPEEAEKWIEAARQSYAPFTEDIPYVNALVSWGRVLLSYSRFDPEAAGEALEVYERAMEIDPLNPLLRVEMADALGSMSRYKEVVDVLEPARENADLFPSFWGALALAYHALGETEKADEALARGEAIAPEDAHVQGARSTIHPSPVPAPTPTP